MASKYVDMPKTVTMSGPWHVIDPNNLKVIPGYNVRDAFDPDIDEDDASLVSSMALATGYLMDEPITVRIVGQETFVISGHRRREAAIRAGVKKVSIIPEARNADGTERSKRDMLLNLIHSNAGKHLAEHEKGAAYLELKAEGMTETQIAAQCGIKTIGWVRKAMKLANANPELKALIKEGWIAPTVAVLLTGAHGEKKATEIGKGAKDAAIAAGAKKASGKILAEAEEKATGKRTVGDKNKKSATPPAPAARVDRLAQNNAQHAELASRAKADNADPFSAIAGPFSQGKGEHDGDMIDRNGAIVCAFADAATARKMIVIVNMGWKHFVGISEPGDTAPAPIPAVPAKVTIPLLTKAQEKTAAKAREAAKVEAAKRETERLATVARVVAAKEAADKTRRRDEAERNAAANEAERKAIAKANRSAPLAAVIASKAIANGTERGAMAQAMTGATTRKVARK